MPPRGGLKIRRQLRLFVCLPLFLPLLLPLSLLVPRQSRSNGFLDAARAAVQAATPGPHVAAKLGAAGLAAVRRPRGETLVWVVDIEGVLPAAHAISI